MNPLLVIFLRTALMYVLIFIALRLMGKREIGKLSVFDLVISIMIAEIAVFVLEEPDKPLLEGLLPMFMLVLVQILLSYVTLKSQKVRHWFDGRPSVIIHNGELNMKEMKKQRYNLDDLMMQLRENKAPNIADVEFAILETTGKLSVIAKEDLKKSTELSKKYQLEGLPLGLIMDGIVQEDNLIKIGKNKFWLKQQLLEKGIRQFKEVFFCSIDHNGQLYINKKQ